MCVVVATLAASALIVVIAHTLARQPGSGAPPRSRHTPLPPMTGFPGASNTGVPSRARLLSVPGQLSSGPGWHYDPSGFVAVDGDGAVLAGLFIRCNVDITAAHVTLAGDKIVVGGASAIAISLRHASRVTIEDSTISGRDAGAGRMMAGVKDVGGGSTGTRVLRDNISLFETGVQLESGLVKDNYLHHPGFLPGDHTNGVMSNGGSTSPLTITHNTILIDRGQTDAIGLFEDFGVQANRVITDNLLAGGSYAIYAGQSAGGAPTQHIVITGNRISRIYYRRGGYYGTIAHFNPSGRGNIYANNTWNATTLANSSRARLAMLRRSGALDCPICRSI